MSIAPSLVDGVPEQVTNALYIVDDSFDAQISQTPGAHPVYYLIMADRERVELEQIGDSSYSGNLFAAEPMSDARNWAASSLALVGYFSSTYW